MLSPELLQILRCPVDPKRQTPLVEEGTSLICPRCQIKFSIKDGFPVMIIDEADLPTGCENAEELAKLHEM
ncbi:MAG: Trm112 family protein [Gemmataceae bacterium]